MKINRKCLICIAIIAVILLLFPIIITIAKGQENFENKVAVNSSLDSVVTTVSKAAPTEQQGPKEPGFEAFFAIAGLAAVAFLVLRQRK